MEADLIARLLADSGLSALVGNRITPIERPQDEGLPAITLFRVSPGRSYTFGGASGSHGTLMQFDVWAASLMTAKQVMTALIAVLEQPATVGGTVFEMSFLQSERDSSDDVPGVGTITRKSVDFLIWWQPV